jgi:hypothetical protein
MGRYDVVDEIVIAAPADVVWNALLDEARGDSGWWRPHVELRRRRDAPVDQPGAVIDIAVHPDGGRQRPIEPRFSSRTVEVERNRRLRGEYFAGWFRGSSEWLLEPVEGGTLVRFHWAARHTGSCRRSWDGSWTSASAIPRLRARGWRASPATCSRAPRRRARRTRRLNRCRRDATSAPTPQRAGNWA